VVIIPHHEHFNSAAMNGIRARMGGQFADLDGGRLAHDLYHDLMDRVGPPGRAILWVDKTSQFSGTAPFYDVSYPPGHPLRSDPDLMGTLRRLNFDQLEEIPELRFASTAYGGADERVRMGFGPAAKPGIPEEILFQGVPEADYRRVLMERLGANHGSPTVFLNVSGSLAKEEFLATRYVATQKAMIEHVLRNYPGVNIVIPELEIPQGISAQSAERMKAQVIQLREWVATLNRSGGPAGGQTGSRVALLSVAERPMWTNAMRESVAVITSDTGIAHLANLHHSALHGGPSRVLTFGEGAPHWRMPGQRYIPDWDPALQSDVKKVGEEIDITLKRAGLSRESGGFTGFLNRVCGAIYRKVRRPAAR
jgi:hypothetical protein